MPDNDLIPRNPFPVPSVRAEYSAAPDLPEETQTHNWLEYWHILRRHWRIVALTCVAGSLVGFVLTLSKAPTYQAKVSIEVQEATDNVLNSKDAASASGSGTDSELMDMQTQMRVMQSENVVDRAAARVRKLAPTTALPTSGWRKLLKLAPRNPEAAREQAIGMAAGSLNIHIAGTTRIIEIATDSTDPRIAALFANTLADEYIEQHVEDRWQTTQRTTARLTRALDDIRVKLERSEDNLQAYARQSGMLLADDKSSVAEEKLRQLQSSLSKAQEDRMARQSRLESAVDASAEPSLASLQDKITDLRRQIAELGATYTPDYPKVKRLQAQIEPLEAAMNKQAAAARARVQSEFEEARRHEQLLDSAYGSQSRAVTEEAEKKIHYDVLRREVDSTRNLYDTMLAKVKEAGIASAMRASNVRVLDPAHVPSAPYQPRVQQMLMMGALAGFFLGAIFIISRDHANRTIQMPGDINLFLNIQELGIIPAATIESRRDPYAPRTRKLTEIVSFERGKPRERVELVSFQRHPSMLAESFRSTLTSLLFSGDAATRPRVLVMTSANPNEGKTTVTTNLAIALAGIRHRVLLIDGDMRRPRLHDIFDLGETPGLRDVLADARSIADSLPRMIHATGVENLHVLSSGTGSLGATNLLYSPRMKELMDFVRGSFDMVLIDTPPMLQIPDARVIGRAADSVILVVRAGQTTRDAALAVRQRLAEDGTPIAGCILNDWNPRHSPGGYYGYYDVPGSKVSKTQARAAGA